MQHATDVDAVLHQHRPVEAVFLEQRLVPRGVDAALARHRLDRIAGHDPDQEERQQRHPDEGRNDEADPGEEEAEHCRSGGTGPTLNHIPPVLAGRSRGPADATTAH